jgi:hypothetical protein
MTEITVPEISFPDTEAQINYAYWKCGIALSTRQTCAVSFTILTLYHPGNSLGILTERELCGSQRLSEDGNMSHILMPLPEIKFPQG